MTKKKNQKAVKDTNSKRGEHESGLYYFIKEYLAEPEIKGKLYHGYILSDENNFSKTALLKAPGVRKVVASELN